MLKYFQISERLLTLRMILCVCFVSCKRERKLSVKPVNCNFKKIFLSSSNSYRKNAKINLYLLNLNCTLMFLLSEKVLLFSRQLLLINVIFFSTFNIMIVLEEKIQKTTTKLFSLSKTNFWMKITISLQVHINTQKCCDRERSWYKV